MAFFPGPSAEIGFMTPTTVPTPRRRTHLPAESLSPDALRGRDILCFSHDWNGDPLSKTHLMRLLARNNRVLWVNSIGYRAPTVSRADLSRAFKKVAAALQPIREPEPNIFVFNPLAIPAYGLGAVRAVNRHLLRWQIRWAMRRLGFRRPINWVFNPAAAVVAGRLGEEQLIYHCVDEYTAFSGVHAEGLAALEQQLLERADLVIVSAERLYQSKARVNERTVLVRHGVDHRHFRRALDPATCVPREIASLPRPVIGFFGLIADWVDLDLMARVARHFSHGSLVMLGKATTDVSALERLPNVHLLGRKPYEELPAYCKGFDVALNPFRVNELTLNANPLKVREYLAAGLPVVSTAIPEVEVLGQCHTASDPGSFLRAVEEALGDPGPSAARSAAIEHESWGARLDEIAAHLAALGGR
jgi:glycosyltransferase involved in cell wall biosynthesis